MINDIITLFLDINGNTIIKFFYKLIFTLLFTGAEREHFAEHMSEHGEKGKKAYEVSTT